MMKKLFLMMFMITSFFLFSNKVSARGELVYDITNLSVSENAVTFKGWAELNDLNNIGGKTTTIKIYALKEGDTNRSNWVSASIQYNNKYNRSLYEANCVRIKDVCADPYEGGQHKCDPNNDLSGCLYEKVGFTASFSLEDLFREFGGNNITFKIVVSNTNGPTTREADLGVFDGNANLENGGIYNGNKFNVKLSNLSSSAKVVVDVGRVLAPLGNDFAQGSAFYWTEGKIYSVKGRGVASSNARAPGLTMYQMRYSPPGNVSCTKEFPNSVKNYADVGNKCNGWAYATWVQVTGKVVVNIKEEESPLVCEVNVNKKLHCENGSFDSSCKETINAKNITIGGEGGCGGGTAIVKANVIIKQKGSLEFSLDKGPIYSGGGFKYSLIYNNEVTWDYAENGKKGCPDVVIEYWDSNFNECKKKIVKSSECDNDAKYDAIIKQAMANKYNGLKNSSAVVSMPDSNNIKGPNDNDTGTWSCTASNVTSWAPNTTLKASCKFTLYDAFIDKQTSNVVYGNYEGDKYIAKGSMYFTPIKYPSGQFPVKATFSGLSSINSMKWNATYECGIECQQKLIEDKYVYYFRPISLSEPFPNNRTPGSNWIDWINNEENKKRLLNTYTSSNNLEYTVNLTNTDIANIKKYNEEKNFEGKGYLDNSIDINGNSDFIKKYNYFTLGNVNHSGLGVFDPGDDMQ